MNDRSYTTVESAVDALPPVHRPASASVWLIGVLCTLLCLGLVAMYSASITLAERNLGDPFFYLKRQGAWLLIGVVSAIVVTQLPLRLWQRMQMPLLCLGLLGLVLVLLPGLGREVNGATRWLSLGPASLQVSEPFKLVLLVYLSGYLVRHQDRITGRRASGYVVPMLVLGLAAVLLLAQPDFGTTAVLAAVLFGMLFVGGVSMIRFLCVALTAGFGLVTLALLSPYRLQRLVSFMDPWVSPNDHSYQLTQSLIAFGRGGWAGEGLGGGLQKLFYLPEAHTDFVFAVLAEELGFIGSVLLIVLFVVLVWQCFSIAAAAVRSGQWFGGYLVYGIGMLTGVQAFINLGVNTGMLPTKGLTLPLVSYGGSSLAVNCLLFGLVLRTSMETDAALYTVRRPGLQEACA